MITCELKGGLGNQLFQIFATIAYSLRTNHEFIFLYEDILIGTVERKTYWRTFLSNILTSTYKYFREPTEIIYSSQHEYIDVIDELTKKLYDKNRYYKLIGYFQSYKYFIDFKETIYNLIGVKEMKENIREEFSDLFIQNNLDEDNIMNKTHYVSMHFRFGDYKYLQHSHNLLPVEYYKLALSNIIDKHKESVSSFVVYIFCEKEDNELISEIIQKLNNDIVSDNIFLVFLKIDDSIDDWKQLLLMSFCQSNIIANSTFSWWGAFFNENTDKTIYYPSVWFGPQLNDNYLEDMFPAEWNKISF